MVTHFLSLIRISQWPKALFVFIGIIYACQLNYWPQALCAAISFCFIASAVYIYNGLHDLEEDRRHPIKSQRPLPHKDISIPFAIGTLIILLTLGILLAFFVSNELVVILWIYLLINFIYNQWARDVPVFDVLCIASGFMLRILAGTWGIGISITWWLIITATSLCFFIGFCKRYLEKRLNPRHRVVLARYSFRVLNSLLIGTASGAFLTYVFYTVYARAGSLLFLLTIPFVILGLFRYLQLIKKTNKDDPIAVFLTDWLSCLNLLCFIAVTWGALYVT